MFTTYQVFKYIIRVITICLVKKVCTKNKHLKFFLHQKHCHFFSFTETYVQNYLKKQETPTIFLIPTQDEECSRHFLKIKVYSHLTLLAHFIRIAHFRLALHLCKTDRICHNPFFPFLVRHYWHNVKQNRAKRRQMWIDHKCYPLFANDNYYKENPLSLKFHHWIDHLTRISSCTHSHGLLSCWFWFIVGTAAYLISCLFLYLMSK